MFHRRGWCCHKGISWSSRWTVGVTPLVCFRHYHYWGDISRQPLNYRNRPSELQDSLRAKDGLPKICLYGFNMEGHFVAFV